MSTTIGGVRIVDMPDLGTVTDDSSVVGEHVGSGRFGATALRGYVTAALQPGVDATLHNTGRNLLHNPLFNVAQRGVGPFGTTGATLDRWSVVGVTDTASIAQAALTAADRAAIGDESGSGSLQNTFTGNAGAGAFHLITQRVEDVRRLGNKTVTVSFWAIATGTLKLGINMFQSPGTGGSPAGGGRFATGTQVTVTTTWARYTATFTLSSTSGMTMGTNNDHYTGVEFWFSSGATNNANAGNIGVQSGLVKLWGVQLEIGSVATQLDKPDPRYDLSNCQRFYQVGIVNFQGYGTAGGGYGAQMPFVDRMRANPTITLSGQSYVNASSAAVSNISVSNALFLALTVATGSLVWGANYTASADL